MGLNLAGFLGPALTVASGAEGAYQQGNANAQERQTQTLMAVMQLKQAAEDRAMRNALMQAQTGAYQALSAQRYSDAGTPGATLPGLNPNLAAGLTGVGVAPAPTTAPIASGLGGPATPLLNPAAAPKDIRDILLRGQTQAMLAGLRPIRPVPIPGAVPGTVAMPAPAGASPSVAHLPGVVAAPRPAVQTDALAAERARESGWSATFSHAVQALQAPQADPNIPGLKRPGLSYAEARAQAAQLATDAWGPAPKGRGITGAGGAMPAPPPAPMATAADSAVAKIAAARIASGKATMAQAMTSPSLSPAVKALLQSGYTGNP